MDDETIKLQDNEDEKNDFLNLKIEQVCHIYFGMDRCCRCGCGGEYHKTPYSTNKNVDNVNLKLTKSRLKRAQKIVREGSYTDTYMYISDIKGVIHYNISFGHNKAITIYLHEHYTRIKKLQKIKNKITNL